MSQTRKIDMVILGLLEHENLTGYDIKKQIDGSINFFWKASFGSIYPALKDLEKNALIKKIKEDNPKTKREKIIYSITPNGHKKLIEWLKNSKSSNDLKYETFGHIVALMFYVFPIMAIIINSKNIIFILAIIITICAIVSSFLRIKNYN